MKLFLILCLISGLKCSNWSYIGDTGSDHWCKMYSRCCGSRQSPVDLKLLKLAIRASLIFKDYNKIPASATMVNNGHTIVITLSNDTVPRITGKGLKGTYFFHSLEMHWGSVNSRGSEHVFGSIKYALEIQLIHYSEKYSSLNKAIQSKKPDALAIVGITFEMAIPINHPSLQKIVAGIDSVKYKGQATSIKPFSLISLLPPKRRPLLFRYRGSLTSPPCNEVVVWTVFVVPSRISQQQVKKLRQIYVTNEGEEPPISMSNNYRPVQPLNGRKLS